MNRHLIRFAALAATAVALGGCELAVENPNAGNTDKVIGTPEDAEALLSTYYKRWSSGVYGSTGDIQGMANVMSLMNYSSLANNCQNNHWPFTNASNGNMPGNVCGGEQGRLYNILGEVNRVTSDLLQKMDSGLTLNPATSTPLTDAKNLRARSFAEFLRGISLGYVAMMYDSAAIISPTMSAVADDCLPDAFSGVCVGALRNYTQVMDSALVALERAIVYANTTPTGVEGFPIPVGWLPAASQVTKFTTTATPLDAAGFVRLIRTYRARLRANEARTPVQRAAVAWDSVIADAQNGITQDHLITTSTTQGPGYSWRSTYATFTTWHQMPPFIIGMADVSGSYDAWIGQPLNDRGAGNTGFFMTTPDLRFPQGASRAAQQADFAITSCRAAATPCKRYFVNRVAGADQFSGAGWGWSNYDFVRFYSWTQSGDGTRQNGNTPFFTLAELDLLRAEGEYRLGNYATAAGLINKTRTAGMVTSGTLTVASGGGLPAITAFDATSPVPGGANCIPKVPVSPAFSSVGCGNLWEALKYEKRIETAYTHYAPWYLDMRGWGDLPEATALFWATPFQDQQARGRTIPLLYGAGPAPGSAPGSAAVKGTYGW